MSKDQEVYIVLKQCDDISQELGFKYEIQAFVPGQALDDVELTAERLDTIVARYAESYKQVYVNGKPH